MKKEQLSLAFLIFFFLNLFSLKSAFGEWAKVYDDPDTQEIVLSAVESEQGGYILVGLKGWELNNFDAGTQIEGYLVIMKIDEQGNKIWQKTFEAKDVNNSLSKNFTHAAIVKAHGSGYMIGAAIMDSHILLMKIDDSGNIIEKKIYTMISGQWVEHLFDFRKTTDGYIFAGQKKEPIEPDALLVKFDTSGNLQWIKVYGDGPGSSSGNEDWESARAVRQTRDGGYIVVGYSTKDGQADSQDYLILRLDSTGKILWKKYFEGGSNVEYLYAVVELDDGTFIVGGNSLGGFWLARLDASGNLMWQKYYSYSDPYRRMELIQTSDGNILLLGNNGLLVKFNKDGQILWQREYKSDWDSRKERFISVIEKPDGSLLVFGTTNRRASSWTNSFFILKLRQDGTAPACSGYVLNANFTMANATFSGGDSTITMSDITNNNEYILNNNAYQINDITATEAIDNITTICSSPTYTLTITSSVFGTVKSPQDGSRINCGSQGNDCSEVYDAGTLVTLYATPDINYQFSSWEGDCSSCGTSICTITMDRDKQCSANFTPLAPPDPSSYDIGHGTDADPVNTATGEYYFTLPLFDLGGPLPLRFSLFYGSGVSRVRVVNNSFAGVTGEGWLHTFQKKIINQGVNKRDIIIDWGRIISFNRSNASEPWQLSSKEDIAFELKEDNNQNLYLKDPSRNLVFKFDVNNRLVKIIDRNGNSLVLTYDADGNLSQVSDGLGRTLYFTYSGQRLISVRDENNRTYQFTYQNNLLTTITDPMNQSYTFEYDSNGRLTKVIYPRGNYHYVQSYGATGKITSQTDTYGNTTTFNYNGEQTTITRPDGTTVVHSHTEKRYLTSYRDEAGKAINLAYNNQGRQISIIDRMGDSTSYTYHINSGKVSSVTDAEGNTTTFTYTATQQTIDGMNFVFYDLIRIDYPDGTKEEFQYDSNGNIISYTDQAGSTWRYEYNQQGLLTRVVNPEGGWIVYEYNSDGTLNKRTDSDALQQTYTYDQYKRLLRVTHKDGTTVQFGYDLLDRLTQVTDERGVVTSYTYDSNGNIIKIEEAVGTPLARTFQFEYDQMDRLSKVIDPSGAEILYSYNSRGAVKKITYPGNNTVTYLYDVRGWFAGLVDEAGNTFSIQRDAEGVPTQVGLPTGETLTFTSNKLGFITEVQDPVGKSYRLQRDALQRITKITDRLGRAVTVSRNARGEITGITLPVVGATTYKRNSLGLVTEATDPEGGVWKYSYTGHGRLVQTTDPLGRVWKMSYNNRGWLSRIEYPDGVVEQRTYDATGNLLKREFSTGMTLSFTYDSLGRLTETASVPVKLTYDSRGLVTKTEIHGSTLEARYDARRLLTELIYDGGVKVNYTYDRRGLLTEVRDSLTGSWIRFSRDASGRITRIERSNGVTTTFERNQKGVVTKIVHGNKGQILYTYDAEDRVVQESNTLTAILNYLKEGTETYAYNRAREITSAGFQHDSRGRRTRDPERTYAYDAAGRLTRLVKDGKAQNFEYTALGEIARKTDSTGQTLYYYNYAIKNERNGHPVVAETLPDSTVRYYVYTPEGRLLYYIECRSGTCRAYFYHFDRKGNTLLLTDSSGNVTDTYGYTYYGRMVRHTGTSTQPFTYRGRWGTYQMAGTGLYYYLRNYYDSRTARYITRAEGWFVESEHDPGSLNPYGFHAQWGRRNLNRKLWKEYLKSTSRVRRPYFLTWAPPLPPKAPKRPSAEPSQRTNVSARQSAYKDRASFVDALYSKYLETEASLQNRVRTRSALLRRLQAGQRNPEIELIEEYFGTHRGYPGRRYMVVYKQTVDTTSTLTARSKEMGAYAKITITTGGKTYRTLYLSTLYLSLYLYNSSNSECRGKFTLYSKSYLVSTPFTLVFGGALVTFAGVLLVLFRRRRR